MRFQSATGDDAIEGSKYGRMGLGTSDIEFLHDLQTAFQESGRGNGPSEELTRTFKSVSAATRAMDTQESGFGQQLVGAQYVGDLWGGRPSG